MENNKEELPETATAEELKDQEDLFNYLKEIGISDYKNYPHKRVFTCEAADEECKGLQGAFTKTLLLKDIKKPEPNFYMVITLGKTKLNLKQLQKEIGAKKHLSFTKEEELKDILGLFGGEVTPFALIRDKDKKVKLVVDKAIYTGSYTNEGKGLAFFHPMHNCASTLIKVDDLLKFIKASGHEIIYTFDSSNGECCL